LSAGRYRWRRVPAGAAVVLCLAAALGCKRPVVGEPTKSATLAGGPEISITGASLGGDGHLTVAFTLSQGGAPLSKDAAIALLPSFTLAALSTHPVDGLAAWKSLLQTGLQTAPQLPPGGPGTPPAAVLSNVRQPGSENDGTLDGADGAFTYRFSNAVPAGFVASETLRVGAYIARTSGTAKSCSTYDYRPAGGAPAPRDTVLDANCNRCHGTLRMHGGRIVGVKLCLTCHTWQHVDPDTADPAALAPASPATDPNPLELGRLVHRIHRGKDLPTLYTSTSTAPAPPLPSATALPLPYTVFRPGLSPVRNPPAAGARYSIVGRYGSRFVYGEVLSLTPSDPNLPARTVAEGGLFPRDLRDCTVCHDGAPQAFEVLYGVSRRTCSGCHPDVWFDSAPITDTVHFAHPGGPQAADDQCQGCHVAATVTQPKLYAPIAQIHVMPHRAPRYSRPVLEIVAVENLVPGASPTVKFKLYDRVGTLSPPNAPTPATESGALASPIPRAMSSLSITMGPTKPGAAEFPIGSGDAGAGNPIALSLVADAEGVFTYTFASTIPATASGTWAVGMEGRRRANTTLYDTATDTFLWPYTGEAFFSTESPENPLVYVDTAAGTYTPGVASTAVPRRTVVAQQKCERCHERIFLHGTLRNKVAYCLICHTPNRTDWAQRPKVSGNVDLGATMDGIEERTIDFKVLIHRLHTGKHTGPAALDAVDPFVVYGVFALPYYFDGGTFPNDLRNCTLCHEGKSYAIESVPADAPWTVANETGTVRHAGTRAHVANEPSVPPVQSACLGCHATGPAQAHAARHTVSGVEQCAQCHGRGSLSVEVVHGLATPGAAAVDATFSSIAQTILVPRCASGACHGGSPPAFFPQLDADAAYGAMVQVPSQQASGFSLVEPFAPERSYLLMKLRGDAGSAGGIATLMPIGDAPLEPAELAAVEAWIANGAPND
jgi:OmcA/MtrC family decaheme c-type cytochrome